MSDRQAHQAPSFDAKSLLHITTNPDTGRFTCHGTMSLRRRCRNLRKEVDADEILNRLPHIVADCERLRTALHMLADSVLCHHHKTQAPTVKWYRMILEEVNKSQPMQSPARSSVVQRTLPSPQPARRDPHRSSPSSDSATRIQDTSAQAEANNQRDGVEIEDTSNPSEDNSCPICYNPFDNPCESPCGYKFCYGCIEEWLDAPGHETCPFDRGPLQINDIKMLSLPIPEAIQRPSEENNQHEGQSGNIANPPEDGFCSICLSIFDDPCTTPCGHEFCCECIKTWLSDPQHESCPLDRKPLRTIDIEQLKV